MTAVGELRLAAPADAWRRIGLDVVDDVAQVGSVRLRFGAGSGGVVGWGLVGAPTELGDIDGLATTQVEAPSPSFSRHQLDIVGFDHLVVMTSSLQRTSDALTAATGEPLKRIRGAGPVRQGFHRLGEVIVEIVESPQVTVATASFWGFVWNVADLPAVCERLGPDVLSPPKPAVQAGRAIASFRAAAGLGLPLALMTPPSRP